MTLQQYIDGVKQGRLLPSKHYKPILDNLLKAEGGTIHYNSREIDITSGYGIYRAVHPNAMVFKYIDSLAIGITNKPSKEWTKKEIDEINKKLDPKVDRFLSYLFYRDIYKGAHLELFDESLVILMSNLFANAPKGAWMSIQEGLRDMQREDIIKLPMSELSIVDGAFGNKTRNALNYLNNIKTETAYEKVLIYKVFKRSILMAMKTYYIELATAYPDKFLINLRGWNNRAEALEHQ